MNKFSENLKELRLEARLSQAALAENIGVNQRTVSNWELGVGQPDFDILLKLARFFDVTADDLQLLLFTRVPGIVILQPFFLSS